MSTAAQMQREDGSTIILLGMLVVSGLGHVATLFSLPSASLHFAENKAVEMEIIQLPPPPPPPPPEEKKEEPKPKAPPPVKVAVKLPTPKEPPPPNDPPPEPTKPVPLVVGISLSSTTSAGGFAAPVGNTSYGKVSDKAVDPNEVKPYAAPRYAPPGGADSEPELVGDNKISYPEEARKAGIEGSVRLKITIDERGNVTEVHVINGPGYGLNEAARDALKRSRFRPATKGGEPVGYTFPYTYTFLLD